MFQKIFFLVFLVTSFASAKEMSLNDLKERLELRADVYRFDGKKLVSGPETTSYWRSKPDQREIDGDWSTNVKEGRIAIRYSFRFEDDGTFKASIEEFAQASKNNVFSESLGKKEYNLDNFEPIVLRPQSIKDKNVVIRFTPSIRDTPAPVVIDNLPVAGTDLTVMDNAGYVWSDKNDLDGKFIGVTTHRGTLALSYSPFKGAKEMGTAEGREITLKVDKKYQITVKSETAFLPAGVTAKVFAIYLPEKKSKGINSVHSFSSSDEERFLKALEQR